MLINDALAGKHALVCGASQGIGQACAIELAKAGARVTVLARNRETLNDTVQALSAFGSGHRSVVCDLADTRQLSETMATIGPDVDILVCNSGGPAPGPLTEAGAAALETAFQQHVVSNLLLVQAFTPHMKKQKYGRVINIISTSVKVPLPNLGVSNVVRGATASAAKTFANELGPFGITVNNILPGFTKTQRLEQIIGGRQNKTGADRADVEKSLLSDVPAGRFAEAQETAYACVFLASPFAAYINGINLPVDGGRTGCL
ncbi:MAG: SDR family oxidoreductase [Chitinophagaceae bacterium]|nr:SDR family oxidoreductase [Oligoflexus sp.]